MNKKAYEVKILNQKFLLQTDSDERYVRKVADFVNEKIFNIQQKTKSVSSLNVSILVALNIADDYFKMRKKKGESTAHMEAKLKELVQLIDNHLQ